jgi:hypothetical protein
MKDLIQLSRHDDHDNPFIQKQATPGPSRQRHQYQHQQHQQTQQQQHEPFSTTRPLSRMSLNMPSPIPISKHAADHRRVESDLNRNLHTLQGLTDDEFDSDHTFSRLGGFGKDTRSTLKPQSRSLMDRQAGFDSDGTTSDDAMNLTRGTELSSFDAHARRSGLIPPMGQPLTTSPGRPVESQRREQHTDRLVSSSTESSSPSSLSTNSIEFGRTAPAQHRRSLSRDIDEFERSLFIGASPVSTLGHHASAVTFGAGIFANKKGGYGDFEEQEEGAEYDPERGLEGLINAVKDLPPTIHASEREREKKMSTSESWVATMPDYVFTRAP